jgi:hypothetical protein
MSYIKYVKYDFYTFIGETLHCTKKRYRLQPWIWFQEDRQRSLLEIWNLKGYGRKKSWTIPTSQSVWGKQRNASFRIVGLRNENRIWGPDYEPGVITTQTRSSVGHCTLGCVRARVCTGQNCPLNTHFSTTKQNFFNDDKINFTNISYIKSRDSSVGIALDYGLDDRGPTVRFPAGTRNFSLNHRVKNGSGAHPASYPMGTRGSYPGSKAAGAWSWPLTSI